MKEEEKLSGGGGGESGAVLAGVEWGTPAAQGEFRVVPGPLRCNCYPEGQCFGHPSGLLESSNESKQRMATHTLSASYL